MDAAAGAVQLDFPAGTYAQMLTSGTNVQRARSNNLVLLRFFHADAGEFRELCGELRGEECGHVLNQKNGGRKLLFEAGCQPHYRGGPAGRCTHYDDWETLLRGGHGCVALTLWDGSGMAGHTSLHAGNQARGRA